MKPSPIEKTASKAAQEKLPAAGQTAAFQNSASSAEADLSQLVPHFLENAQSHTMLGMKKLHAEQNCARENLIFLLKREASAEGGDLARLALDYLEDWQLSRNRSNLIPKSVQAAKIEALGANLHRCVMHLEKLSADGDRESVQLLAHHTLRAAKWLSSTRKNQLKLIKPIARQSVFWPVLKSRCQHFDDLGKSLNQHDAVFLRDLGVGREHLIQGCKVKLDDELGVLMLDLIDEVESNKPMLHFSPLPKGWRADAIQLPRLRM